MIHPSHNFFPILMCELFWQFSIIVFFTSNILVFLFNSSHLKHNSSIGSWYVSKSRYPKKTSERWFYKIGYIPVSSCWFTLSYFVNSIYLLSGGVTWDCIPAITFVRKNLKECTNLDYIKIDDLKTFQFWNYHGALDGFHRHSFVFYFPSKVKTPHHTHYMQLYLNRLF